MAEKGKSKGLKGENSLNPLDNTTMSSAEKEGKKVSRKEFVKGTAVGAAGVAAAGVLAGCAPAATPTPQVIKETVEVPVEVTREVIKEVEVTKEVEVIKEVEAKPWLPEKWDYEADVVVVGSGCAGGTAGLKVHDEGAKTILIEKASVWGGTTSLSGGALYVPNNHYMREAGVKDSREDAINYLQAVARVVRPLDEETKQIIETFVDTSNEMLDYIEGETPLKFTPFLIMDYHPEWPGALGNVPVFRTLIAQGSETSLAKGIMGGKALTESLREGFDDRGIEYMLETPAKRLIVNNVGRVIGLVAENGGKEILIKANKAVILASGGFEWNDLLMGHYMRGPLLVKVSYPDINTGDGLLMGMALGADLRNMNECGGVPSYDTGGKVGIPDWFTWRGLPGSIIVNRFGERFCNEASDYDVTWRSWFAWDNWGEGGYHNIPSYLIDDATHWNNYGIGGIEPGSDPPSWITKADTPKELAAKLGIDPDGLALTIENFNANAREGRDPQFHRGESLFDRMIAHEAGYDIGSPDDASGTLAPLETSPFYGAKILAGTYGTRGGLRVNMKAQVLNSFGEVIPGLYAAGNVSGAAGVGYTAPGHSIGHCMVFGYLAAKNAAAETPWE